MDHPSGIAADYFWPGLHGLFFLKLAQELNKSRTLGTESRALFYEIKYIGPSLVGCPFKQGINPCLTFLLFPLFSLFFYASLPSSLRKILKNTLLHQPQNLFSDCKFYRQEKSFPTQRKYS